MPLRELFTRLFKKGKDKEKDMNAKSRKDRGEGKSSGRQAEPRPEWMQGKRSGLDAQHIQDRHKERRAEDFANRHPDTRIAKRSQLAAESIVENEALTADLDDNAAKALITWGVACAQAVAQETVDLDDAQAEEAMHPRMKATRQLMRSVTRLVADEEQMDEPSRSALLEKILELARTIYGKRATQLDSARLAALIKEYRSSGGDTVKLVESLRRLFESDEDTPGAGHAV